MTPEEADQLLRGLTLFVDIYEEFNEEMPTTLADIATIVFSISRQGPIARNDRGVIAAACEKTKEAQNV